MNNKKYIKPIVGILQTKCNMLLSISVDSATKSDPSKEMESRKKDNSWTDSFWEDENEE